MSHKMTRALAVGLAGALAFAAVAPASAAPVFANRSLTALAPDHVTDVQWRGRRAAIGAGIVAGALVGAAIASRPYYPRYYGPGYPAYGYYPGPVVVEEAPVYDAPVVYAEPAPVYAPRAGRCWVATDRDRGFGYWRAC